MQQILLLKRLKRYSVSVVFVLALWYLSRRRQETKLLQKQQLSYKKPPMAPTTTNSLIYRLLGHSAEIRPWIFRDIGIMSYDAMMRRFHWYKAVERNPDGLGKDIESVRVKLVFDEFLFTKDLDIVSAMIGREDTMFRNSDTIRHAWGAIFPKSVSMLTGDDWKRVRRILISAVYKLDLEKLPRSTCESLIKGVPCMIYQDEMEVNLWDFFSKMTFDTFLKFTYRMDPNTMLGGDMWLLNSLRKLTKKICDRMVINFPWLWYLPFGVTKDLFKLKYELEAYIDELMDKRIKLYKINCQQFKENSSDSLVDALIVATEEAKSDKRYISHEEVRSQLVAAMFGGFDTTTSTLSFLYICLCEKPEYQEILYQEIKDINLQTIKKKVLDNLPYLNSIIKESQRLHAVAPLLARVPNEDVIIQDTFIEKDTMVMVDSHSLGQVPKYWDNASDLAEFKPERWFNFKPVPGAYQPFGFGGRKCPGYRIAFVQLQTILTFLTQNYRFQFAKLPITKRCSLGFTVSPDATFIAKKRKIYKD